MKVEAMRARLSSWEAKKIADGKRKNDFRAD